MIIVNGGGQMKDMFEFNQMLVDLLQPIRLNKGRKPYVLFLPTASFESKPYINNFVKEFGSRLKCKATCAIWRLGEMDYAHIKEKFDKADMIYIGGGRYDVLLDELNKMNLISLLIDAYKRGVILVGNSAGAMLMFEQSVSDCKKMVDDKQDYVIMDGLALIGGIFNPHAEEESRKEFIAKSNLNDVINLDSYQYKIYE